jgi:predicted nucleotidyltransferase
MIDALMPKVRREVLALLFRRTDEPLYLREIVRETRGGKGAVERELRSLTRAGILLREKKGNFAYYRTNQECPIYPELQGLFLKTAGLADILRAALSRIGGIKLAFVYGSMAQGTADARSDVDVLVVTDGAVRDVSGALLSAQKRLGREISPTVYSLVEFKQKLRAKHHFLSRVLQEPRIMLIGDVDDIARVG